MGIDWLVSSGLWRKGRRSDLSTRLAQRVLRTHAPTSRVTRAQIQTPRAHVYTNRSDGQAVLENGSYCYGYYLPLIRTGGRLGCVCVGPRACVACNAWICDRVCVRREKGRSGVRLLVERTTTANETHHQPDCRPRYRRRRHTTPWPTRFSRYPAHDPQAPHFMRGQPTRPLAVTSAISIQRHNGCGGAPKLSYDERWRYLNIRI